MNNRQRLDAILSLYHPNVGRGNYQGDVSWRGANETLVKVAVKLGLATEAQVAERFKALDAADWNRSEATIARMVERDKTEKLRERGE